MSEELFAAVSVILRRVIDISAGDAELRAELRRLCQAVLAATQEPPQPAAVAEAAPPAPEPAPPAELLPLVGPVVALDESPDHQRLPAAPSIEIPVGWYRRMVAVESDLQLIEARCRLKAEGARWAAARQRRISEGASYCTEIEPRDREIIAKAKPLEDCFLWMNHSSAPIPADLGLWDDVAGCFEASAMALALLRQVMESGEKAAGALEKALDLAAEAQSALRAAVGAVDGKPDSDQQKMYHWLRQTAAEEQIFIRRFMRLDDPADPTQWNDLQERIGQLDSEIEGVRQREKQRLKTLKKGQYHAKLLREGSRRPEDWKKVIEVVEALVADGAPPSNTDLRDLLVPIVDDLPDADELPDGFRRVLAEVDRYLATQAPPPPPEAGREVSGEVARVAGLYADKTLALIGGERRPHAYDALKSAFRLKELVWITTREHESTEIFVPYIARPDIDGVLLAIRWTSHSYGDVRGLCEKYGKDFYRLPAGYNPNQVAHQILQQRGDGRR